MPDNYYQLFKKLPDEYFIKELLYIYGIKDFDQNFKFTLRDLEKREVVSKLQNMENELGKYYLNCKFKKYVADMTLKKSITVLRHFLKIMGYKVESKEKYSDNKKYLVYNIRNIGNETQEWNFRLSFD